VVKAKLPQRKNVTQILFRNWTAFYNLFDCIPSGTAADAMPRVMRREIAPIIDIGHSIEVWLKCG